MRFLPPPRTESPESRTDSIEACRSFIDAWANPISQGVDNNAIPSPNTFGPGAEYVYDAGRIEEASSMLDIIANGSGIL